MHGQSRVTLVPNFEAAFESLQECRGGVSLASASLQACGQRVTLLVETLSDQSLFREFRFCSLTGGLGSVVHCAESLQACGGFTL